MDSLPHPLRHSLVDSCTCLIGDGAHNPGSSGRRSNHPCYPARAVVMISNIKGPSQFGPPVNFTSACTTRGFQPRESAGAPAGFSQCDDWASSLGREGPRHSPQSCLPHLLLGGRGRVAIALTSSPPDMLRCTSVWFSDLVQLSQAEGGWGGGGVQAAEGLPHPLTQGPWD